MEADSTAETTPRGAQPQKEHRWLEQLVGEWTVEAVTSAGSDGAPEHATGHGSVRSIGGLWIVAEDTMHSSDLGTGTSIMTLGYDPVAKHFTATFISSMMTYLWLCRGELNERETALTLSCEGPGMAADGATANYRDVIEFLSPDHRTLTAYVETEDGSWTNFMTAHYRRK